MMRTVAPFADASATFSSATPDDVAKAEPKSFRWMSKQTAQNLNLFGDCATLVVASALAAKPPGSLFWHWMVFQGMAAGSMLLWTLCSRVLRHYDVWNGRGIGADVALMALQLTAVLTAMALLHRFVPAAAAGSDVARFAFVAVPTMTWLRLSTSWLWRREIPVEHVVVVGIGPLGRHTGHEIHARDERQRVFGYLRFDDERPDDRLPAPILGSARDIEDLLRKHVVSEVYLAGRTQTERAEMQATIRVLERFGIPFALPAAGFRFGRARPEHERAVADGYIHYLSVRRKPVQAALKRFFDIVASAFGLAMLSPLLVAIAVLVRVTSRGPVFFRQERVGLHGRTFRMLKFRSMVVDAEAKRSRLMAANELQGPVFKMKRDPRVTPLGRFIRKYSIDELPQLVNVLRGDMSIVGPRPPIPAEVAQYEAWQRRRLSVRPGITCVWQVSGRNDVSFEEWMYLDMQYIDHWNLAQDFRLILRTVPVVLTGRGAS
jgi:exopolysaccharide biosynthesis polyprenyl glycosylphosphotransferase